MNQKTLKTCHIKNPLVLDCLAACEGMPPLEPGELGQLLYGDPQHERATRMKIWITDHNYRNGPYTISFKGPNDPYCPLLVHNTDVFQGNEVHVLGVFSLDDLRQLAEVIDLKIEEAESRL